MTSTIDFNGTGAVTTQEGKALRIHEQSHSSLSFVFLSELHLDDTKALSNFRAMLQGYMDANFIPFAFVLCGSFVSSTKVTSTNLIQQYQDGFSALGELLVQFPSILKKSHFIFVPSSEDPFSTSSLPRKHLPKSITDKLLQRILRGTGNNVQMVEKFQFVSNPCRLVYFGQEIVVFRDDLMQRMLRNTIVGVKERDNDGDGIEGSRMDLKRYLVSTILDQAHLCPLPQSARPVLWEFDHALRLYPMPSAVSQSAISVKICLFSLAHLCPHYTTAGSCGQVSEVRIDL
jgi:DNA polymerase epsilon subunit 2